MLTLVLMNAWMRLRERLLDCDAWRNSHKVNFDLMLADRMYYYMQWLADMLVKFKYAIR